MSKLNTKQDIVEQRELEAVAMNIVHQIGDSLYEALPKDVAHEHFVKARQATNDLAVDFAKKLINDYAEAHIQKIILRERLEEVKYVLLFSVGRKYSDKSDWKHEVELYETMLNNRIAVLESQINLIQQDDK